ncbi:hypothetical protein L6452_01183 [Arctium lappa]|uniref:Uncharacterized protein n=1 Tax=Arctium lappa TaxID=4217 RepID=A0ACB9FG65_ARCLA|nr:hypothetical protein L6452_01183 [Arctium lappa]
MVEESKYDFGDQEDGRKEQEVEGKRNTGEATAEVSESERADNKTEKTYEGKPEAGNTPEQVAPEKGSEETIIHNDDIQMVKVPSNEIEKTELRPPTSFVSNLRFQKNSNYAGEIVRLENEFENQNGPLMDPSHLEADSGPIKSTHIEKPNLMVRLAHIKEKRCGPDSIQSTMMASVIQRLKDPVGMANSNEMTNSNEQGEEMDSGTRFCDERTKNTNAGKARTGSINGDSSRLKRRDTLHLGRSKISFHNLKKMARDKSQNREGQRKPTNGRTLKKKGRLRIQEGGSIL